MSEQYVIVCPQCRSQYQYSDEFKGRKLECPNCGNKFMADENVCSSAEVEKSVQSQGVGESAQSNPPTGKIEAKCDKCGYSAYIAESFAGKKLKCPKCSNVFTAGDAGGFEVVEPAPKVPQTKTFPPAKLQFAKDYVREFPVTLTYQEPYTSKIMGKVVRLSRERTIETRLGETTSIPINVPTVVHFEIGGTLVSGDFTIQPGGRYIARKSGLMGMKWDLTEVDLITGASGTYSGLASFVR